MKASKVAKTPSSQPKKIGAYLIIEEIGRGGMGCVYKAQRPDGSIVALKVLGSHLHDNEIERNRFFREANIATRLDHPNLIRALDFGEDEGQHYFAMEFVDGFSLGAYLAKVGKIREEEAIRIIVAVAKGLAEAHRQGLIHRDVKPDNILMTADGHVKLVDLGLARELDDDTTLTRPDRGLGTPIFMAPEQFRNAHDSDQRCDVYALGQTLYVMVTGKLPFSPNNSVVDTFLKKSKNDYVPPEKLVPHLRTTTVRAINQAMESEVGRRPRDVDSFVNLLLGKAVSSGGVDLLAPTFPDIAASNFGNARDELRQIYAEQSGPAAPVNGARMKPKSALDIAEGLASTNGIACTAIREEFDAHPMIWFEWLYALILLFGVASLGIAAAFVVWHFVR